MAKGRTLNSPNIDVTWCLFMVVPRTVQDKGWFSNLGKLGNGPIVHSLYGSSVHMGEITELPNHRSKNDEILKILLILLIAHILWQLVGESQRNNKMQIYLILATNCLIVHP